MFWVLWLGITLIFSFSIIGVFAWNGTLLELVKIKTAKNWWVISACGITLGLILFIASMVTIMNTPSLVIKFSDMPQTPPTELWVAIFLLLIGGFIVGIPTQLYQLRFTKISKGSRSNIFYIGMFLLVLSAVLLIWLLMPGNQLPS